MSSRAGGWCAECTSAATSRRDAGARNGWWRACPRARDTRTMRPRPRWNCVRRCLWIAPAERGFASRRISGRLAREKALHTLEESRAARRVLRAVFLQRLVELAQHVFLFRAQVDRCLDRHPTEQIAARSAADGLHAFIPQAEDSA